ncbi:hypothetical protein HWC80_gp081 [Mycobacterium phage Indlulamithi]|uniref:Uncharacterized protein n=1 Tax=Mycobacterium phage Indlulamithi TaxID=2656582 RepID=A0A649VCR3_9CAUD|nr:hypothetical protein HWC80_gp081 [Mycobacterium phage Indlulamithi]QGJ90131.1 hypothetical protein PBI_INDLULAMITHI_93 [Mycobacterium phage Indlulamithi]
MKQSAAVCVTTADTASVARGSIAVMPNDLPFRPWWWKPTYNGKHRGTYEFRQGGESYAKVIPFGIRSIMIRPYVDAIAETHPSYQPPQWVNTLRLSRLHRWLRSRRNRRGDKGSHVEQIPDAQVLRFTGSD